MTENMVRVDRAALADSAAWVGQAISKNPNHPVLGGIKITAALDGLTLSAFDYDAAHTAWLDAEVLGDWECLVSGRFLIQIVSAIKGGDVTLTLDGGRLTITSGRSTYRVATMQLEDFPTLPDFPEVVGKIEHADLMAGLGIVGHAASRNNDLSNTNLGILQAVSLVGDQALTLSCCDRFQVGVTDVPWSGSKFASTPPATAVLAALKGMVGTVEVGARDGALGLADGARRVVIRTLAGQFPALGPIFGKKPTHHAEVDAVELAEATKRAALLSKTEASLVIITISADEIAVTSEAETGDGAEYVSCESNGETRLRMNAAYFAAGLLAAGTGRVRLGFLPEGASAALVLIEPIGDVFADLGVMSRRGIA